MKKRLLIPLTAFLLTSPLAASTQAESGHDMSNMKMTTEHAGMATDQTATMKSVEQDGVMARPHLADVREAMAKHSMKETHHLMVMFSDIKTGKPITEGAAAVKVTDPAGVKGDSIPMMLMGDGFGADVSLSAPGKYTLEVGTKLGDAKKRIFTFSYGK